MGGGAVSDALHIIGIAAAIWLIVSVVAGFVYWVDAGDYGTPPFRASKFAAIVLWPISLVLLVIRGAREGLSDCLYGEDDEANP